MNRKPVMPDMATYLAANLWAKKSTSKCIVDMKIVNEAAKEFRCLIDQLEAAWGIIANAGGGNWKTQTKPWQKAANKWRNNYNALVKRCRVFGTEQNPAKCKS